MTPKRLHLPNPPGDLWEHIRSSLDEALVEILDPGEQWALGGGTLLAAEWEHRGFGVQMYANRSRNEPRGAGSAGSYGWQYTPELADQSPERVWCKRAAA